MRPGTQTARVREPLANGAPDWFMALKGTQFVSLFLQVLVVGAFWGTWLGLSRSMMTLTPETFLEVGHLMVENFGPIMRLLVPAAVLSTLLCGVLLFKIRPEAAYLTLAGFLCFVGATLITLLVNVPIDELIAGWTVATLPADWREIRDRWETFHTFRTFLSLAGLASTLAGSLLPIRDRAVPT
jgi:hypothetical protein